MEISRSFFVEPHQMRLGTRIFSAISGASTLWGFMPAGKLRSLAVLLS